MSTSYHTTTDKKLYNSIMSDVLKTASHFEISHTEETSNGKLTIYCTSILQRFGIIQSIETMMQEKYPKTHYKLEYPATRRTLKFILIKEN